MNAIGARPSGRFTARTEAGIEIIRARPAWRMLKRAEARAPIRARLSQRRLVAALDAEAAQMDSVRALLPRFEAKIQRVLDRVWGNGNAT